MATVAVAALLHASAHVLAAVFSVVLLELGVETCIRSAVVLQLHTLTWCPMHSAGNPAPSHICVALLMSLYNHIYPCQAKLFVGWTCGPVFSRAIYVSHLPLSVPKLATVAGVSCVTREFKKVAS